MTSQTHRKSASEVTQLRGGDRITDIAARGKLNGEPLKMTSDEPYLIHPRQATKATPRELKNLRAVCRLGDYVPKTYNELRGRRKAFQALLQPAKVLVHSTESELALKCIGICQKWR